MLRVLLVIVCLVDHSRISRGKSQWKTVPHAIIDNKHFQIYVTDKGREYAARRGVGGVYRKRGNNCCELCT